MIGKLITILFAAFLIIFCAAEIVPQTNAHASASLLRNNYTAPTDTAIELGIQIILQNDWHIYWRNPGDSGIPTNFEWELPGGIKSPKIFWPIPKAFVFDDLVSYGYDEQVLFIAELEIPKSYTKKKIELSVKLKSLICKNICIPFDTNFTLKIDLTRDHLADEETSAAFIKTKKYLPKLNNDLNTIARMDSDIVFLNVHNAARNNSEIENVYFIPYENGIFRNTIRQQMEIKQDYLTLKIEPDPFRIEVPKYLFGILVFENSNNSENSKTAYEINVPVLNINYE